MIDGRAIGRRIISDFIILILKLSSKLHKIGVIFIKLVTISDDLANVSVELGRSDVDFGFEIFLDCLQVHGLFNNI